MKYSAFITLGVLALGLCATRAIVPALSGATGNTKSVQVELPAAATPATSSPVADEKLTRVFGSVYGDSIKQLGGQVVDPMEFPQTVEGFNAYLSASGVKSLKGDDFVRPNHPEIAARLGYQNFLPEKTWWPRGAALALLTQGIQTATSTPVHIRNWWRPTAYNTDPGVKGAKNGDHPTANAVDLDYNSVSDRMAAERYLRDLDRRCPWMHISLGLGAVTTHVGIGSPKGHREWHYAGWIPATNAKKA